MLYSIIINENTDLEFKIFPCSFIFKNAKKRIFGISAYFNRINYYYCIANEFNFNSVEIIFVDFSKSNLYLKNISINYDNQDFLVKEEFNDIKSRKRISFINIDIKKLKLPKVKSINNNMYDLNKNSLTLANYLISIERNLNENIIGIYKNQPLSEMNIDKKKIIQKLNDIINPVISYLDFKDLKETPKEYFDRIDKKKNSQIYATNLKNSFKLSKDEQIQKYFSKYIQKLDKEDEKIYELFCEFLLLFPELEERFRSINPYIKQYYYSKSVIINFKNKLPVHISKQDKLYLLFSACRVLNSLLRNNLGARNNDLFEFIDLSKNGNIYYDAIQHNQRFIELLKEESEIFPFLLQMNSGSSANYINLNEPTLSSRISMLSLA